MRGDSLISTEMFGSGARTTGTIVTTGRGRMEERGWIYPGGLRTGLFGAAVGAAAPCTAGRWLATTTRPASAPATSVSASLRRPGSWRCYAFTLRLGG